MKCLKYICLKFSFAPSLGLVAMSCLLLRPLEWFRTEDLGLILGLKGSTSTQSNTQEVELRIRVEHCKQYIFCKYHWGLLSQTLHTCRELRNSHPSATVGNVHRPPHIWVLFVLMVANSSHLIFLNVLGPFGSKVLSVLNSINSLSPCEAFPASKRWDRFADAV